jgi:1-acyl-sn-glycerol-3-phosphate acyltransferase
VRWAQSVFRFYCRTVLKFYCPLTVSGREWLPTTPYILCSNHASHLDSVALMVASGRPFHEFAMVAAQDYFFDRRRLQSAANLLFRLIPIDRRATRRQLEEHIAACRAFFASGGRGLIIFPEGTRSRTGRMQSFKRGTAVVAAALGVPLVPAAIEGTFKVWPKGHLLMRPGRLRVRFGVPIQPEAPAEGESPFATYRRITAELERRIHELLESPRDDPRSEAHEVVGMGRRTDGV